MAFFPCIYFCENNQLYFTGKHINLSKMNDREKVDYLIQRADNRHYLYKLLMKLFAVAYDKGLRLVVENPYSSNHYLYNNFPFAPKVIDRNRMARGDYYKKPTQYFFFNCENTTGSSYQAPTIKKRIASGKSGARGGLCSEDRSMISPDYARNFICDFIIGKNQPNINPTLFD